MVHAGRVDWLALARQQSDRFWSKVDKSGSCWIWKAGLDKNGYGKFAITAPPGVRPKQKHVRAHRLAWELRHGRSFPVEKVSRHGCDTPGCVLHVTAGTQKQNRTDCVERGRQPRGEVAGRAKLTNDQAKEIARRASSETYSALAAEFGVSKAAIGHIVSGRNWRKTINSKADKRGSVGELLIT